MEALSNLDKMWSILRILISAKVISVTLLSSSSHILTSVGQMKWALECWIYKQLFLYMYVCKSLTFFKGLLEDEGRLESTD